MESQRVRHDSVTQQQHKISHALVTRGQKQSFERSLGQTYLLILKSLLERQRAIRTRLGVTDTGDSRFWELFYYTDTGAGNHHFGALPLAY